MEELFQISIGDKVISIRQGDITEEKTDAIVNAANPYLKHGGGIAGAVVKKGGHIIQEESDRIGYVPVGGTVVTSAGKLPCNYIIHAVGPRWGEGDEHNKLRSAVRNALKEATKLRIEAISIPAISTGIFGFPKEEGVRVIFSTAVDFLRNTRTSLKRVHLCNIDEETTDLFVEEGKRYESRSSER